jgi:hypothetical protein
VDAVIETSAPRLAEALLLATRIVRHHVELEETRRDAGLS